MGWLTGIEPATTGITILSGPASFSYIFQGINEESYRFIMDQTGQYNPLNINSLENSSMLKLEDVNECLRRSYQRST